MKELILLITGLAAASAVCFIAENSKAAGVKEGFGGIPSRTINNMPEVHVQNKYGSNMYTVPPSWQSRLSPRFSNTSYGAHILYNIPAEEHLGVPSAGSCALTDHHYQSQQASRKFPLTMGGHVHEGYGAWSGPSVSFDRTMVGAGYTPSTAPSVGFAINQEQSANKAMAESQFVQNVGEGKFLVGAEKLPEGTQIYNYDRLVYAQKKSRLHRHGDPFRGDLPIVPIRGDWFRPAVSANIDLRQGAIHVMSGYDAETSRELRALQNEASGRAALAQKDISFDNRQSDIYITSYP